MKVARTVPVPAAARCSGGATLSLITVVRVATKDFHNTVIEVDLQVWI